MPQPHIFDSSAIPWAGDARFPGIEFKVFETRDTHPTTSVVIARVAVGSAIQTHTHPVETETAYVLAGEGVLTADGKETTLSTSMGVTIPPGTAHSLRNTGDAPLELLAMHSPPTR